MANIFTINTEDIIIYRDKTFDCTELHIQNACCCIFNLCSFPKCQKITIKKCLTYSPIFFYCNLPIELKNIKLQYECHYLTDSWKRYKEICIEDIDCDENIREITAITMGDRIRSNLSRYYGHLLD